MNADSIPELVETGKLAAEEELGYTLNDMDMEYVQSLVGKIAGSYMRREQKATHNRKVKAKNRANNKAARKSRKANRK